MYFQVLVIINIIRTHSRAAQYVAKLLLLQY